MPFHLKAVDDTTESDQNCACLEECDTLEDICANECECVVCCGPNIRNFRIFESAYRNNWGPAILESGPDYDQCIPKDLKMFVEQRGLKDPFPEGLTLKSSYLPILDAADRVIKFRFLDLPPELRNNVYGFLLTLSGLGQKHCYPEILATNREINNDAKGILYADNTLVCDFTKSRHHCAYFCLHNDRSSSWRELSIPAMFTMTSAIEINVNILDYGPNESVGGAAIQNSLLLFASSLMDTHALKKLKVTFNSMFNNEHSERSEMAETMLYPLRRLRNITEVEVTGDLSVELAESIKNDMQGTQPAFNTWNHVVSAKDMCGPLARYMLPPFSWTMPGYKQPPFGHMWRALPRFGCSEPVFADADTEARARLYIDELMNSIPSMSVLRHLRKQYSDKTR